MSWSPRWRNRVWSQRLVCIEPWDQDQLLKQPERSWVPILVKFLGSAAVLVAFHTSVEALLHIGRWLLNLAPPREFKTFFFCNMSQMRHRGEALPASLDRDVNRNLLAASLRARLPASHNLRKPLAMTLPLKLMNSALLGVFASAWILSFRDLPQQSSSNFFQCVCQVSRDSRVGRMECFVSEVAVSGGKIYGCLACARLTGKS